MTYPTKFWKARNVAELENSILVEYRELGKSVQSAVCGSEKSYRALIRKLRRQGFVNINQLV